MLILLEGSTGTVQSCLCVIPIYLYPRVNIGCIILFTDKWKDSGITGVLCLVTCRKLKSNVIRIYDGDVTMSSRNNHMQNFHLLFEMELYEGFTNHCSFGARYLLVPFIHFCFCFLFEDVEDSQDCINAVCVLSIAFLCRFPKWLHTIRTIFHKQKRNRLPQRKVYLIL